MKKYLISIVLLLLAIALLFVRSDRLVLQLRPTPGMANAITVSNQEKYEQDIVMYSTSIARAGFYLAPTVASLPSEPLTLTLYRGDEQIAQSTTSSVFIDADGSTLWQFNKPVEVTPGETIRFRISISQGLSEKIRLKLRQVDDSFNPASARFLQDGQIQRAPLAYEMYSYYKPPLAQQLAGLLAAIVIFLLLPKHRPGIVAISEVICACWFTFLYLIPLINQGTFPWFLWIVQSAAFYGMYRYLRVKNLHPASALAGAAVFAYTSWFALQYSAHRFLFSIIVWLPLALIAFSAAASRLQRRIVFFFTLAVIVGITVISTTSPVVPKGSYGYQEIMLFSTHIRAAASPRDVFLDPYQAPQAQKVITSDGQVMSWDNFGSYVGVPAVILTVIGLLMTLKTNWPYALGLGAVLFIHSSQWVAQSTAAWGLPVAAAHLSIISTFFIAFFTAQGIEGLYKFFGYHRRLTAILLNTLVVIMLVDIWHIAADLLESLPLR